MRLHTVIISILSLLLLSCSDKNSDDKNGMLKIAPQLLSFNIQAKDNPYDLVEDVEGVIIGDSVIQLWAKHVVKNKILMPRVEVIGGGHFC